MYLDLIPVELLSEIILYSLHKKDVTNLIFLINNKKTKSDKFWSTLYFVKFNKLITNLRNLNEKAASFKWYYIYIQTMKLCKNKEYCKIIERGNVISFDNIKSDSCSINNDMTYLITLNNLNIVYPLMVKKLKILPHLNISVI